MKTKIVRRKLLAEEDRRGIWDSEADRKRLEREIQRLFGEPVQEQPIVDLELGIWRLPD